MVTVTLSSEPLRKPHEIVEATIVKRSLLGYGLDDWDSLLTFHSAEDANLAMPFMLRAMGCRNMEFSITEITHDHLQQQEKLHVIHLVEQFLKARNR